jgi:hypothetical protein
MDAACQVNHFKGQQRAARDHHEPSSPPPACLQRPALHEGQRRVEQQRHGRDPQVTGRQKGRKVAGRVERPRARRVATQVERRPHQHVVQSQGRPGAEHSGAQCLEGTFYDLVKDDQSYSRRQFGVGTSTDVADLRH